MVNPSIDGVLGYAEVFGQVINRDPGFIRHQASLVAASATNPRIPAVHTD
jgi:hypothetical protein